MAVSFDIRPPLPESAALGHAISWLHWVDATFSTYRADSTICLLGRGESVLADVDREVRAVLRRCLELSELTAGAFDVFELPERNGTTLDPSGYVKGWSVERAAAILERAGATNFCINAAGDVLVRGQPGGAPPWYVGLRHPDQADALSTVLHFRGSGAVATSGNYERGTHVVDPRTGRHDLGLVAATIVGPDLGEADAFATTVLVMGLDGLGWIEGRSAYEAYLVTSDGRAVWSSGFDRFRAPHPDNASFPTCDGTRVAGAGLGECQGRDR